MYYLFNLYQFGKDMRRVTPAKSEKHVTQTLGLILLKKSKKINSDINLPNK